MVGTKYELKLNDLCFTSNVGVPDSRWTPDLPVTSFFFSCLNTVSHLLQRFVVSFAHLRQLMKILLPFYFSLRSPTLLLPAFPHLYVIF